MTTQQNAGTDPPAFCLFIHLWGVWKSGRFAPPDTFRLGNLPPDKLISGIEDRVFANHSSILSSPKDEELVPGRTPKQAEGPSRAAENGQSAQGNPQTYEFSSLVALGLCLIDCRAQLLLPV